MVPEAMEVKQTCHWDGLSMELSAGTRGGECLLPHVCQGTDSPGDLSEVGDNSPFFPLVNQTDWCATSGTLVMASQNQTQSDFVLYCFSPVSKRDPCSVA